MEWNPTLSPSPTRLAGKKRPAPHEPHSQQPLAKRLELLTLRPGQKPTTTTTPLIPPSSTPAKPPPTPQQPPAQRMEVDHVVFVDSLSDSESESDAGDRDRIVFIPDIERRLNAIPKHVLRSADEVDRAKEMQLVLYSVPQSRSDNALEAGAVRRAIIESRARARAKAAAAAMEAERKAQTPPLPLGQFANEGQTQTQIQTLPQQNPFANGFMQPFTPGFAGQQQQVMGNGFSMVGGGVGVQTNGFGGGVEDDPDAMEIEM